MILLKSNGLVYVNPLYPVFSGKKFGSIRAVNWETYKKGLIFYLVCGLGLCIFGLLILSDQVYSDPRLGLLGFLNLVLSGVRTLAIRNAKKIKPGEFVICGYTSFIADLEFSIRFLSFSIACLVVLFRKAGDLQIYALFIMVTCLMLFLMSLLNVVVAQMKKQKIEIK